MRIVCAALLLLWCMPQRGTAQSPWMVDRRVAFDLQQNGDHQETERASLHFDAGAVSKDERAAFAGLVDKGIKDIATFLGVEHAAEPKVRYYISNQFEISHSRGHSVYLPLERVMRKTAPYLHETLHVIAPCQECPMWFSEGLASYVQSYVSEHMGGYDGIIFARNGNRGIDRDALRWLSNDRGKAVLPYIGTPEEPEQIGEDRSNVAAPFYVMGQSLVKYIVESIDKESLRAIMSDSDFENALKRVTGKTPEEWKQKWLGRIRG